MIESKNDLKEITYFVKKKFPEAEAVLLTGSFASNQMKKNSDIDLIIFSESVSHSFVEKFKIDSQKYDVIYLSTHYNYLLKELYLDINTRFGVYANMISTSKILFDNNNILKDLIYFSKNILIKEYGGLNSIEIEFRRKLISNALEDIEDIDSFGEFYFSSSLIVEEITNLILSSRISTIGRGKNKARELEKIDTKFYHNLTDSIMKFDKIKFKTIVIDKLDLFGGILDTYSPKDLPSIISEENNKYEILIKRKYFKISLISKNYHTLLEFFKKNNINLLYYYYQNDNIVMIINSAKIDRRVSRNIISWLISNFKIESSNKVIIRVSKTKLVPFVSKKINEGLEMDLVFLTEFIKSKKIYNTFDAFTFSTQLIEKIINYLFPVNKKVVLEYLFHSNILNIDDLDSLGYNYFQLIDIRKKIIEESEILSESLYLLRFEKILFEDCYCSLNFPKMIKNMNRSDLNILKGSVFCDDNIKDKNNSTKLLILNFYLKYLLDIINENNQLSIIANILKKRL